VTAQSSISRILTSLGEDRRALVAIDLGAESCRVSLLRWFGNTPDIQLLHRIVNGPVRIGDHLHWPLDRILTGIEDGLRKAAEAAPEGIRSIAVDGWAVDYVRLNTQGNPYNPPFCYRDERNIRGKGAAEAIIPPEEMFYTTGAQPLSINTVYQLLADQNESKNDGYDTGIIPNSPWLLLPEFVLHWLGAERIAEYTNATHTGLVDLQTQTWSPELFTKLELEISTAPEIVPAGTFLGNLSGPLAAIPSLSNTQLIAPACHDTASAIAAITADLSHSAYIVSGTWSLVGTVVDSPVNSIEALNAGFTNQGAAAGGFCFHTNVNGMWILKQCLDHWDLDNRQINLISLIELASQVTEIPGIIPVDASPLMLAGLQSDPMPARINVQLAALGLQTIPDVPGNECIFAHVIFSSLASKYASVLKNLATLTGRQFTGITILGGGSRNSLLSRLTEQSTGLPVSAGEAEGSTLGNFSVQLAALSSPQTRGHKLSSDLVRSWATFLSTKPLSGS